MQSFPLIGWRAYQILTFKINNPYLIVHCTPSLVGRVQTNRRNITHKTNPLSNLGVANQLGKSRLAN